MVLSWSQPTHAESRIEWVVPSGQEETIKGLLGTFGNNAELEGGYRFSSISPKEKSIRYSLTKDGQVVGALLVQHLTKATGSDLRGKHLSVRVEPGGDPKANTHLAAAANEIIANDLEPIFKTIDVAVEPVHAEPPPPPEPEIGEGLLQCLIAACLGFLWLLFAGFRSRPLNITFNIKRSHILPMSLQTIIFLYWSVYWVETVDHMSYVAFQLLFAYLIDAALSLQRHKTWGITMGPFPIVFSTNLFVWYQGSQTWCAFAIIAIAIFSKSYLQRGGKHIFNPSALGISVLGILYMVEFSQVGWTNTTVFTFVDVSHPLTAAPNMTELILMLALIPQFRFPIVTLSMSALVIMVALGDSFGGANPFAVVPHGPLHPLWPPVFLAITLLATDPATIPKTANGKVFFGLSLGLMITLGSALANGSGADDYFTKVMPIPILNLLSPRFDSWGKSLPARFSKLMEPRLNRVHMATFVLLTAIGLVTTEVKQGALQNAHFVREASVRQLDLKGEEDICAANPPWCQPFSFAGELSRWTR